MSAPDNTKDFTPFHGYIKKITSGIISRSAKKEVSDEIMCHLMDNYELALTLGMNHEKAIENALSKMGDSEALSYRLGKIHSYNPLKAMNSAITKFIAGFILSFFSLPEFSDPTNEGTFIFYTTINILSIIFIFSSLLRMRKADKKLYTAFHLYNGYISFYFLTQLLPIGRVLPLWLTASLPCSANIIRGVFYLFFFGGLYNLCVKNKDGEKNEPYLKIGGTVFFLLQAYYNVIIFLNKSAVFSSDENHRVLIFGVCYLFVAFQLFSVRKVLWDADGEYGILPSDKKHKSTVFICVAAIFLFCGVYNYVSATKEPVKTELIIHDISENEKQVADKTREKMLSWGMKQEHLDDLPDSEILKYKNAIYGTWSAEGAQLADWFFGDTLNHADITYYAFVIPVPEKQERYIVRLLYVLEPYYHKDAPLYRMGFYRTVYDFKELTADEKEMFPPYISVVTNKNGKKYETEPFIMHNINEAEVTLTPKGFEFSEEEGQCIYYAESFDTNSRTLTNNSTTDSNLTGVNFLVTKMPTFVMPYSSTAALADEYIRYCRMREAFDVFVPFYESYMDFSVNFNLYTDENGGLHYETYTDNAVDEIIK